MGARLEPFTHVDLQLAEGRNLDTITQAVTLTPFAPAMGADYQRYTSGTVMLETVERLVPEDKEPATQQFLLLVGALRALAADDRPAPQVLDSFLLRSLAVAGYAPSLESCTRCGAHAEAPWFSPAAGGVLCGGCRVPGAVRPAPESLTLLGALLAGDWDRVAASEERQRRESSRLISGYLAWHLERGLRSMAYLER